MARRKEGSVSRSLEMIEIHPKPMDPGGFEPKKTKRKSPIGLLKFMSPSASAKPSNHSSQETLQLAGRNRRTSPSISSGEISPASGGLLIHSRPSSHSPPGTDLSSTASADTSFNSVPTSHQENKSLFLSKVQLSGEAIRNGDYERAVSLYTEALALDPSNHILYSNRSAAYIKLGRFKSAVADACKARELNPRWTKAYFRQGLALQCLGNYVEALVAFAAGIAVEPKDGQLLGGLVDAAMKSPMKDRFRPIRAQLQGMDLDKSPFVILSIIGQELLSAGCHQAAAQILEHALRIGTCSLKLRGSVFSALSRAYWEMGSLEKGISFMHQDLSVAKSLGDHDGECRAYGNLGAAYFSKHDHQLSLTYLRFQLVLSMRLKQKAAAASALSHLGHVYTAIGDYTNALASHKQCVLLVKAGNRRLVEAREIGNVGAVYLATGDFENAVECHNEHLKLARHLGDKREEARALSNLGSAHHFKRRFDQAMIFHKQVLAIGTELKDRTLEARAYAGLGHAARCKQDYTKAKHYHEKQLDNALQTKDKTAEGRACSNLGIIYQQLGEFDAALKLHESHLVLAKDLMDKAGLGRAYGNLGNAYSAVGDFKTAIQFHRMELAISKDVNDRHSEAGTHGNLAVCYQASQVYEKALHHYHAHLTIAQELKDVSSEARALSNLGNYHCSRKEYNICIPYYEQYLILSQELSDVVGEGCACHKLGFAHYSLGNIREAIRYYEHDLALAKDLQDKGALSRAYCNLGLALKTNGDLELALECQRYFLALVHSMKDGQGEFRALGNIGDIFISRNHLSEAVKFYDQQLSVAKRSKVKSLEATVYGSLGAVHKLLGECDKALGFHNHELMIYQETDDARGECRAHASIGNVHMALSNFTNAYKCYHEQLERSKDLADPSVEAQAYGNLAITKMNLGLFEDSIGSFERQLAILERCQGAEALRDKGKALANLSDCYGAIADYDEAIRCYEQYLAISLNSNDLTGQERAYRGLGTAHRSLGNLQQALMCFEKRVVLAHELKDSAAEGSAYGELGCLHSMLGNYEQALSCLQRQLDVARSIGDSSCEADAACGLGGVLQRMGDYDESLKYHQIDLSIAEKAGNSKRQCRAYGNIGLSHESLGDHQQAVVYQERHLSKATEMNDKVAETLALTSLGRIHHNTGNHVQGIRCLQRALLIAEQLQRTEDEAKIRQQLGLSLLASNDLAQAQQHLYKAAHLFECIRRDAQLNSDYKLSLFDLQTTCYQALQRILVSTGRHEEAIVVAERGRTRAFVDLLLEKQDGADRPSSVGGYLRTPMTFEDVLCIVSRQSAAVLYYSLADGVLYSWLITPDQGFVKFHETKLSDVRIPNSEPEDTQSLRSYRSLSSIGVLDDLVTNAWESFGLDQENKPRYHSNDNLNASNGQRSETESEADDLWQQHLEEIGEQLNSGNDRSGFLRMVNRDHPFNCSTYSSLSLFSHNSALTALNRNESVRKATKSQAPLRQLYDTLLAPMEVHLEQYRSSGRRSLVLVLQGDLFLIPFSVLKSAQGHEYLFEKFDTIVAPSLQSIAEKTRPSSSSSSSGALVVGNPALSPSIVEQWQWRNSPGSENEARLVAEMLGTEAWIGPQAVKDHVVREMPNCEIIHLATHVSWKLAAVVLAPPGSVGPDPQQQWMPYDLNESTTSLDDLCPSNFLLTAADILNLQLQAKVVVLSSGHSEDRAGRINSDGLIGLTRAFLASGARCVLYSLWTIPVEASRLLLKAFYTALLQGVPASGALTRGIAAVQTSGAYSHSSNWAGWVLVGNDVKLASETGLMGNAFRELLEQYPDSKESMRVLLHLVEKSLQRIARGQTKSMYTTQASIAGKMSGLNTWKTLLKSVGFRFEPENGGMPAAVFFPASDPGDNLAKCSASLQAMLGFNANTISALVKILPETEVGEAIIRLIRSVTYSRQESRQDIRLAVRVWSVPGCHEFLASLGFDLLGIGDDEVTLKLGKHANRRLLQCGLTTLLAAFDTMELPRALSIRSGSSVESLNSSHTGGSGTSTSNYSRGSTPPSSPTFRSALADQGQAVKSAFHRPKPARDDMMV